MENSVECISERANVDSFKLDVSKLEFNITENLKSTFSKLTFEKFTLFKIAYWKFAFCKFILSKDSFSIILPRKSKSGETDVNSLISFFSALIVVFIKNFSSKTGIISFRTFFAIILFPNAFVCP